MKFPEDGGRLADRQDRDRGRKLGGKAVRPRTVKWFTDSCV